MWPTILKKVKMSTGYLDLSEKHIFFRQYVNTLQTIQDTSFSVQARKNIQSKLLSGTCPACPDIPAVLLIC
jgi:hypothetical protein